MTILFGTGFEFGVEDGFIPAADAETIGDINVSNSASAIHTGAYGLSIGSGGSGTNWVRFPVDDGKGPYTEMYVTVWLRPSGNAKSFHIEFELDDGTLVGVRKEGGTGNREMHAYVDGVNKATGTVLIPVSGPHQLFELYVKIADVGGRIVLKYNTINSPNIIDINYTGDTKATAATDIKYIRFGISDAVSDTYRIDDVTVRSDDWIGDVRYISQVPNGDDSVAWTPSAGGTNYLMVDEIPPSDADYVSTSSNEDQDLYDFDDYATAKALNHIVQWIRAFSAPSGGEIKMQCSSGATVSEESTSGLDTAAEYVSRILETDPNTDEAWGTTGFNAALFGQEAEVSSETVTVTQHILETAYAQNSNMVARPLGMDVDLESGSRVWVTTWEAGALYLRRYPSNLGTPGVYSFGAATENEVAIRTYYLVPYTPPFFGTASLNDIVYVYGRWDDGAVTHIEKSIDGGDTFTDIGDSGTWGAGWVGAFLADDANTLYAFVNGGSRALYRSTNGGTNWTQLSALPFDVEAGGVSKHPDGQFLIINRDASGQMGAYSKGPDYSSWIDATGSPNFPTVAGSNAVIWIT